MADTFKGKVQEVGNTIAEKAKEVGHKVGEAAEKAADWAKEKAHQIGNRVDETAQKAKHAVQEQMGSGSCETGCGSGKSVADIKERMDVFASCGKKMGVVDHVDGNNIKLTKNDSADGMHHLIPSSWVDHVDSHVHLSKNSEETAREWQPA